MSIECNVKGLLEAFILSECKQQPKSGKEIMQIAERLTDGSWRPSAGSVYPLLQRMEEGGLLKAKLEGKEKGRRKITYELTTKGKTELAHQKKHIEEGLRAITASVNPIIFRIAHEFDYDEINEMKKFWWAIYDWRDQIMKLKKDERSKIIVKMFEIWKDEMERTKRRGG